MIVIKPIIYEQWIVDGRASATRPSAEDALYIKSLLQDEGAVDSNATVLHSLILDNNILTDLIEDRRPANNRYLEHLLRLHAIEINPTFAIIEQRQKYASASGALRDYADYLERTFGCSEAKHNLAEFEQALSTAKDELTLNVELLSGYLAAIAYLYPIAQTSETKLEWLSGMVQSADVPFFQLHFYFAALVFLSKERPELFTRKDVEKIASDMKVASTIEKQEVKIRNLSNDLALLATAIFPAGDVIVFPYIATRDRLMQLFLSQVSCQMIEVIDGARANGSWSLISGRVLADYLGDAIALHLPKRAVKSTAADRAVRKSRLDAFRDQFIALSVKTWTGSAD